MNNLKKWIFVLFVAFGTAFTLQAQEESAAALYNEGLASLKDRDFQTGYEKTKEALEAAKTEENEQVTELAQKNLAKASYYLGLQKLKDKEVDEAMNLFEEGIVANPEYSSIYKGKAEALSAKGKSAEAVEAYFKSVELYEKSGKQKSADKSVKKAEILISKLYIKKKYDDAIEAGNVFLGSKESHTVNYYVAKSYEKQNDQDNALLHINKAVEQAGDEIEDKYYWAQGNIAEKAGKKEDAIAAYKKITAAKFKDNADFKIKNLEGK